MSDFIETPEIFQVQVFDYVTSKTFVNKLEFDSYDEATNFIKNYDFQSSFGSHPVGINIITLPKITLNTFSIGDFNGSIEK